MSLDLNDRIKILVDSWCDRRLYPNLKIIFRGWPLVSGLTDDWAELHLALKGLRDFRRDSFTKDELAEVEELIREVDKIVYRR